MSSLEFRVDPSTKSLVKVTESTTTEDELRAELQAAADSAQNRLNVATDAKAQADANLTAAAEAVDAAEAEFAAANEEVSFSAGRVGELDEAVRVLHELAESSPEEEASGDESEAVPVEVHVADSAPV